MDGQTDTAPPDKALLSYPFEGPPPRGTTLEVAPGVHWIRMPLPYALDHINLWALDDGTGWALVDTGTRTDDNAQVWRELFANAPDQRGLTRILVTHMHPDHIGMAGWLTRKFNVRMWMTRLEYMSCRVMVSDTGREAPPEAIDFYRHAGWGESAIESYRLRFGNFGKHIHALPESFRRIRDQEVLNIGGREWRVVVGTGHSPEHACLYCAELGVLISGDQVLPRISSNVSVHPTEPDADPMSEWLDSLAKLKREVPPDVLVLPSHNEPFRGLHARLDRLASGQAKSFERLRRALAQPRRVVDVFGALFARSISEQDVGLLGMATGETLACLNHLMSRGEVRREARDGVHWYQLSEPAPVTPGAGTDAISTPDELAAPSAT
ncbi:MBL fold metallo-hydrolase [Curvibacter sp. HBC28]|uniref:MBL fold metallo-hydrolase n=1 Tax=Curvibacter microcysteis TaxID=3026419 RepID=A0ABT5MGS0_9BURK|nr:MBL fold metallo-hydrolase [Curvibacter sp. HBC28]MDD0815786.1 MBL fold metallo-hydrolase [Curvibacter sp. HBC28]